VSGITPSIGGSTRRITSFQDIDDPNPVCVLEWKRRREQVTETHIDQPKREIYSLQSLKAADPSLRRASLKWKRTNYRAGIGLPLVISSLLGAITSALAQHGAASTIEKWRPVDGYYESPVGDFGSDCRKEYGVFTVELAEKSVHGFEWNCKISKVVDMAPGAIKLDMTCYDLNMPTSARDPDAGERPFKEIMLLKRITNKSMSVRKTIAGKFKGPAWQADYCPEDVQQMRIEEKKRAEENAKYKIPVQLSRPNQWRPKDGIYASGGPDFSDRCAKSGDIAIGLVDGSISSGKAECKVVEVMNTGQAAMSLNMTCSQSFGKQAPPPAKKPSGTDTRRESGVHSLDVIRMSRIDDNTFHMQKTVDKRFKDDGGPVVYCPEDAQRAYAARKPKK
jgi:hypothetical protein